MPVRAYAGRPSTGNEEGWAPSHRRSFLPYNPSRMRPSPPSARGAMAQAVTDTLPVTLEARTREIGRDLFARIRRAGPGEPWWDRWVMGRMMGDESVKAQLFRFVDVLPALTSPAAVNAHLREYLAPVAGRLPGPLGRAVGWVPRDGWLGKRFANLTHFGARRMALRFIAASNLPGAIEAAERLRKRDLTFTVDLLGEAILSAV